MSARTSFVIAERPFYTNNHRPEYLDEEGYTGAVIGAVVTAERVTPDTDGDIFVMGTDGDEFHVSLSVLVPVDVLVKGRNAEDTEEAPTDLESFHEVTLSKRVIRPTALAKTLRGQGMSAEAVKVTVALAVLNSYQ